VVKTWDLWQRLSPIATRRLQKWSREAGGPGAGKAERKCNAWRATQGQRLDFCDASNLFCAARPTLQGEGVETGGTTGDVQTVADAG